MFLEVNVSVLFYVLSVICIFFVIFLLFLITLFS